MLERKEEEYKNYYDILEISHQSTPKEINDGYIRAKNAYSPDNPALYSIMTTDECNDYLEQVEEAYSILSNALKRRQYDEAHGIAQTSEAYYTSNDNVEILNSNLNTNLTNSKNSISKIVANKKFVLDYTENPEFEATIERTTEFTGEFLKKIREYKNIDIPRMADMTRVSKTYIKFIEEENHDDLPAVAYTRGFVYQYAKCLKLNPDLVATSYINIIKARRR